MYFVTFFKVSICSSFSFCMYEKELHKLSLSSKLTLNFLTEERCFPLKLYACNNVTKYTLFLFDLAKCIFYGTVLLYILFIKRRQFNWDFCSLEASFCTLNTCERCIHCIAKLLDR